VAVTATPLTSELLLIMDNGIGTSGQQLTKTRTIGNLKTTAADEDVYSVAQGILSLQEKNNISIQRNNASELIEII
jgi:uncharacterized protein YaaR (DUF327 family)